MIELLEKRSGNEMREQLMGAVAAEVGKLTRATLPHAAGDTCRPP